MDLYGVPFHPNNSHIHCLAHVVNLVVQKMLSVAKEVDDPEFQDYYEHLNKQFPVHYDLDSDEELHDFESEEDDGSKAQSNLDLSDGLVDQESGEQDRFDGMGAIEKVCLVYSTSPNPRYPFTVTCSFGQQLSRSSVHQGDASYSARNQNSTILLPLIAARRGWSPKSQL